MAENNFLFEIPVKLKTNHRNSKQTIASMVQEILTPFVYSCDIYKQFSWLYIEQKC